MTPPKLTRLLLVGCLLTLLLSLPMLTLAQDTESTPKELSLSIAASDSPLVISGTVDGQTTAHTGNVRLTMTGASVAELRLLASELIDSETSALRIDRSHVTIPAGTTLTENQPIDVQVTVSNISRPGVYTGELKFLLPAQPESEALIVPLNLHLDATPNVQPVQPSLTFQVVRCSNRASCWLATWLLPESAIRDEWELLLDNQTLTPVELMDAAVIMRGDQTGNVVRSSDITLSVPTTLPARQVKPIGVTIFRNRLPPDRYRGTFRFALEADDPVVVNVDLDVRNGPLWPLLVVLLGIIVGRLARDMETPAAQTQVKLMPRYLSVQAKATAIQEPETKRYVQAQLKQFKTRFDQAKEPAETLVQALETLAAQINFLVSLDALEQQLQPLAALAAELEPKFAEARRALRDNNLAKAEEQREQIEERLNEAQTDGSMGAGEQLARFQQHLDNLRQSGLQLWTTTKTQAVSRTLRLLAAISGIRLTPELRYWIIRPILWFLLLILLTLFGLQTLYVNAGATFGAAGVYDYLGLFLWALTADVASSSLINLAGRAENQDSTS